MPRNTIIARPHFLYLIRFHPGRAWGFTLSNIGHSQNGYVHRLFFFCIAFLHDGDLIVSSFAAYRTGRRLACRSGSRISNLQYLPCDLLIMMGLILTKFKSFSFPTPKSCELIKNPCKNWARVSNIEVCRNYYLNFFYLKSFIFSLRCILKQNVNVT